VCAHAFANHIVFQLQTALTLSHTDPIRIMLTSPSKHADLATHLHVKQYMLTSLLTCTLCVQIETRRVSGASGKDLWRVSTKKSRKSLGLLSMAQRRCSSCFRGQRRLKRTHFSGPTLLRSTCWRLDRLVFPPVHCSTTALDGGVDMIHRANHLAS
jgi:hypothetical protein